MDTVHITEDNSFFYNGNIDPDFNCLNSYTASSSYYTLQQFIDNVHKSKDLSIIHINCRSLNANFTDLKILSFVLSVILPRCTVILLPASRRN